MKRIVPIDEVLDTFRALFCDIEMWEGRPNLYARDLERLDTLIRTRGVERVILVDLPGYAKSFDLALSRGSSSYLEMPLLGKSSGVPLFLQDDFRRIFDEETGLLLGDASIASIKTIRQVLLLFKKATVDCTEETINATVSSFFRTDSSLRAASTSWSEIAPDWDGSASLVEAESTPLFGREYPKGLLATAQAVADILVSNFKPVCPDSLVGNHGPGSVSDATRGDDKYNFPSWSRRLDAVFPLDYHSFPNSSTFVDERGLDEGLEDLYRDQPSKLIAVAKTYDKPRLIASEPTANQFIQGALRRYLREQISGGVLSKSIDITNQRASQLMAAKASQDCRLATVDLKDASDRLTCWTIERVFRRKPDLLVALSSCRTLWITYPKLNLSTVLHKYAPQGNATVFPVQCVVYAILSIAATLWQSGQAPNLRSINKAAKMVRVFGDDIILPSDALFPLSLLLKACELQINSKKTHYNGNFAESCGFDAFHGMDVTPCYVRHLGDASNAETISSCIEVSNNFYVSGYPRVADLISNRVAKHYLNKVCQASVRDHLNALVGIGDRPMRLVAYVPQKPRTFWHNGYQREYVRDLILRTRTKRLRRESWVNLAQYCIENPSAETDWSSGWNKVAKTKLGLARD